MPKQFPEWTFLYDQLDDELPPENVSLLMSNGIWVDAGMYEDGDFYPLSMPFDWDEHTKIIAWMLLPPAPVHPSDGTALIKEAQPDA